MISKVLGTIVASFMLLVLALVPVQSVAAQYNPFSGVRCSSGQQQSSAVCKTNTTNDPVAGTNGIILRAARILSIVAGAAAVIVIILSGIRYITSAGDPSQISQAKNGIIFALVGLAVILLAQPILNFVIIRI